MISASHIHAMVIHFPIALLLAGFLSEVISLFSKNTFFRNAAFYLLVLGSLGAAAAYISGNYAGEGVEEGPLAAPLDLHEDAALITLWFAIITTLFWATVYFLRGNKSWTKWAGILLFTGLVGSIGWTGYLGGQLVYKHGAGVEIALPDFNSNPKSED